MRVIMRQVLTTPSVDNALSFIVPRYPFLLNKLFASGSSLERNGMNAKGRQQRECISAVRFFFFNFPPRRILNIFLVLLYLKYTVKEQLRIILSSNDLSSAFPFLSFSFLFLFLNSRVEALEVVAINGIMDDRSGIN